MDFVKYIMTNFFEKLKIAVTKGGNCVNLGRSLVSADPSLYQWVIETSCFLDSKNPKFTERVWNVLNNNNGIILDSFGKPARFVNLFKGYSLKNHTYTKSVNKSTKLSEKAEKSSVQKKTKTKIEIFLERNFYRNASLYIATAVEGIDYVCCPMSGARLRFIRKDYIEKVLGINLESYKKQFPNQQMVCSGRVDTIKAGLQQVDSISGVSKHALSIQKSRVSKNKINPLTGITPNQQIGKSARKTHMSNVDEYGRNGYQKQAYNRITTILPSGKTIEQESHEKRKKTVADNHTNARSASKLSKKSLLPVLNLLDSIGEKYYFDNTEFVVYDRELQINYFYDLVCPSIGLVVEYQSIRYHAWPKMSKDEWLNWREPFTGQTADEKQLYEDRKSDIMKKVHGMDVRYVWEPTTQSDVEEILCFLKTQIMKY